VFALAGCGEGLRYDRRPASKAKGVKFLRMEANAVVYEVGSGTYQFQSSLPETIK
jgi:hypothetical protein